MSEWRVQSPHELEYALQMERIHGALLATKDSERAVVRTAQCILGASLLGGIALGFYSGRLLSDFPYQLKWTKPLIRSVMMLNMTVIGVASGAQLTTRYLGTQAETSSVSQQIKKLWEIRQAISYHHKNGENLSDFENKDFDEAEFKHKLYDKRSRKQTAS